jgi:uncharacterized RDD family membrane protein YckC
MRQVLEWIRSELVAIAEQQRYAGFWLRAAAAIVDLIVLAIPLVVFVSFLSVAKGIPVAFVQLNPEQTPSDVATAFGKPAVYLMLAFFLLSGWLYFALLESSAWQGTIGKKVLGLYVADLQGKRATFGRASGRFLGGRMLAHLPYAGLFYFSVDCVCAGLTGKKQAIHDVLAGCLVLRKQ